MEGGFDKAGNFVYLPITSTTKMTEVFRHRVIKLFVDKKLITDSFARGLLCWKHSGFSIDNSVKIPKDDKKTIEALAQYIARCPWTHGRAVNRRFTTRLMALENIEYKAATKEVVIKAGKYKTYFKDGFKVLNVLDFIALLTQHIPPKNKQYVSRYGLYASRTCGIWAWSRAFGLAARPCNLGAVPFYSEISSQRLEGDVQKKNGTELSAGGGTPNKKRQNSTWARLIKKVYGVDPLVCPKCGSEMKILSIVLDPEEIKKILAHLVMIGRSPPNFDPASLI